MLLEAEVQAWKMVVMWDYALRPSKTGGLTLDSSATVTVKSMSVSGFKEEMLVKCSAGRI